ncbi:MAG: hypothetical protein ACKVWR_18925, partial [Acidimicrobiales bacterium]
RRAVAAAALALARRPDLWATALRVARRLAAPGWLRRAPHLPLPDAAYLEFRLQTMYGAGDGEPTPQDLIQYLEWRRNYPSPGR